MRDFDRSLNDKGRRGAAIMGAHIKEHGIAWDMVLASPAARVVETLAIALPQHAPVFDKRLYLASAEMMCDTIRKQAGEAGAVLIVSHNPGLQDLLFTLVGPEHENDLFNEAVQKFPTASFAVLRLDIDDWAELGEHCGVFEHFARPRDLDASLGPAD